MTTKSRLQIWFKSNKIELLHALWLTPITHFGWWSSGFIVVDGRFVVGVRWFVRVNNGWFTTVSSSLEVDCWVMNLVCGGEQKKNGCCLSSVKEGNVWVIAKWLDLVGEPLMKEVILRLKGRRMTVGCGWLTEGDFEFMCEVVDDCGEGTERRRSLSQEESGTIEEGKKICVRKNRKDGKKMCFLSFWKIREIPSFWSFKMGSSILSVCATWTDFCGFLPLQPTQVGIYMTYFRVSNLQIQKCPLKISLMWNEFKSINLTKNQTFLNKHNKIKLKTWLILIIFYEHFDEKRNIKGIKMSKNQVSKCLKN